jgi:pyruvate dehydrogenase E2 component (dihydrolipoamide acetyltransferase)
MPEVRMPKMGDGMEEGTILRWIKQEGDTIAVEEPIAEIETDKANVEMPAEDAGTLSKIVVREGETVAVGAVIAYIGEPGPAATDGAVPQAAVKAIPTTSTPTPIPAPFARDPSVRIKSSPLARRMARELGIDLARVVGTGGGLGRIVARDIIAYQAQASAAPTPTSPPIAKTPASPPPVGATDHDVSRMRKAIARRTVQSKQQAPHFYLTMPVEMDRAMDLLGEVNANTPDRKITVNDLIVKACAVSLTRMPEVNASYTPDEKLRTYATIYIGIAVGTDAGLTIPVIVDCGSKSLRDIAAAAKELIGKARSGSLTPQDMSGGTFTVSNLGMFGIEEFAAILNPPEAAILAVGAVAPEVMVQEDGSFVARRRMRVTLSCDHRVVDGLLGARFLQDLRGLLENPLSLLV